MSESSEARAALAAAQAELDLRAARIDGLERLLGQMEGLGRRSAEGLASLITALGVAVSPDDVLPSRVPELVARLTDHLIETRNRFGVQVEEARRLMGRVGLLEDERIRLLARLQALGRQLDEGRGSPTARGRDVARGRLRILMALHDFLPRHRGGTEIYSWRLAKALAIHHDVHLFFTEAHPEVHSYQSREGTFDGLPFTEISHQHVATSFEESWSDPKMDSEFASVLDRVRPDVVHIQHLEHLSLGIIGVAKAARVPVVYTLHDYALLCPRGGRMIRPDLERCERPVPERCAECISTSRVPLAASRDDESLVSWILPGSLRRLIAAALPRTFTTNGPVDPMAGRRAAIETRLQGIRTALADVDLFLSPSGWLQKTFVQSGMLEPGRIQVSENGQDPGPFRSVSRRASPKFRVGYIGAIVPEKGVHVLVDALNQLSDVHDLEAVIHGFKDADPGYVARLEAGSENPRVTFPGAYAPGDVAKILAGLDAIVVPSLWWENSPLTIQEAFLAGVPVLVSGIGGMAEKVEDGVNGIQFPAGDSAALAARLRELHADRGRLARLSAGRPIVKTIAEDAQELEARYRELLASSDHFAGR